MLLNFSISDNDLIMFHDCNLTKFKVHADGKTSVIDYIAYSPVNRGMERVNPDGVVTV